MIDHASCRTCLSTRHAKLRDPGLVKCSCGSIVKCSACQKEIDAEIESYRDNFKSCRFAPYRHVTDIDGLQRLPIVIYALVDPRDNTVRYIGQTNNLNERMQAHRSAAVNKWVGAWVRDLATVGQSFQCKVITRSAVQHADAAERYWIAFYRSLGTLFNESEGGGSNRRGI